MAQLKINISDPSFNTIKSNIKSYLQSQDTFTDYDFDGSGLSVIIDTLAYNTHYTVFYANMLANESFLETAQLRGSVARHASQLGYTPTSVTAANLEATVTVTPADGDSPATITIPKETRFTATSNSTSFTIVPSDDLVISKSDNSWSLTGASFRCGRWVSESIIVDTTNVSGTPTFKITDQNIDTATLQVSVQTSIADTTTETFTLAGQFTGLTSSSKVYFLRERADGHYEIYFGDGVVGQAISDGNIIHIAGISSTGKTANNLPTDSTVSLTNGSAQYTVDGDPYTTTDVDVTITTAASGGADRETIESIKYYAPRYYEAQGRAVTANDYKTLLKNEYNTIKSVAVWSGIDNDPVNEGTIYIAVQPTSGDTFSTADKTTINTFAQSKACVGLTTTVVDPDYIYLILDTTVSYDSTATTLLSSEIDSLVRSAIEDYGTNTLNEFDQKFRLSTYSNAVEDAEDSIVDSLTNIELAIRFTPSTVASVAGSSSSNSPSSSSSFSSSSSSSLSSVSSSLSSSSQSSRSLSSSSQSDSSTSSISSSSTLSSASSSSVSSESSSSQSSSSQSSSSSSLSSRTLSSSSQTLSTSSSSSSESISSSSSEAAQDDYTLRYGNAIRNDLSSSVVSSTSFTYYDAVTDQNQTCYFDEDGEGNVRIYYLSGGNKKYVTSGIGTIDYTNGIISLSDFGPVAYAGDSLSVQVKPVSSNIAAATTRILKIDMDDVTTTITAE